MNEAVTPHDQPERFDGAAEQIEKAMIAMGAQPVSLSHDLSSPAVREQSVREAIECLRDAAKLCQRFRYFATAECYLFAANDLEKAFKK